MSRSSSVPEPRKEKTLGPEEPAWKLWRLWQAGERPDVQQFLARAGPLTPDQLSAVLRVDQRQRWMTGERILAESYLQKHPPVETNPEAAVDLVYGEFLLREELGETPVGTEYLRRFPQYAAPLQVQFDLHQAVDSADFDMPPQPTAEEE